jgi:hypothetical protein
MFFKNADCQEALCIEIWAFNRYRACKAAGRFDGGKLKKNLESGSHQGTSTVSKSSQALSAPLLNG